MWHAEFIIVGGGLGGGVLAALLARAGREVMVLERGAANAPIVRPEVLWPATVRVLESLLDADAMREAMVPVQGLKFFRGDERVIELARSTIASSGVQPWSTDPGMTRAKLLELGGFEVRRGVEAVGVLQDGGRITGIRARVGEGQPEVELRARWMIGDDGVHSTVREGCRIALDTRLFPIEFFCFGFDWPGSLQPDTPHVFLNPVRGRPALLALGGLPLPRQRGAGLVAVHGRRMEAGDLDAEWQDFRKTHPGIAEIVGGRSFPRDFVRVKRPWGHAAGYGMEGAMLLGDAVHPVSPAGGQGANMSVQDARALADVLLSDHPQPVAEYERRRRAANERSMSITRRAADLIEGRGAWRLARPFAGLVPVLANIPVVQRGLLRAASRAFCDET